MTATQAPKDTALRDVRVKALTWEDIGDGDHFATSLVGSYHIRAAADGFEWEGARDYTSSNCTAAGWDHTEAEAKAAAQADFEARILSALEPSPALVQSNRERDQAQSWRTMESAPKDGTQIIVPIGHGFIDVVSWWGEAWREGANGLAMRDAPTHWMPIPVPPVLSSLPRSPSKEPSK